MQTEKIMENIEMKSNVIQLSEIKDKKLESISDLGAGLNHVEIAIKDLSQYSNLPKISQAISSLEIARQTLSQSFQTAISNIKDPT